MLSAVHGYIQDSEIMCVMIAEWWGRRGHCSSTDGRRIYIRHECPNAGCWLSALMTESQDLLTYRPFVVLKCLLPMPLWHNSLRCLLFMLTLPHSLSHWDRHWRCGRFLYRVDDSRSAMTELCRYQLSAGLFVTWSTIVSRRYVFVESVFAATKVCKLLPRLCLLSVRHMYFAFAHTFCFVCAISCSMTKQDSWSRIIMLSFKCMLTEFELHGSLRNKVMHFVCTAFYVWPHRLWNWHVRVTHTAAVCGVLPQHDPLCISA